MLLRRFHTRQTYLSDDYSFEQLNPLISLRIFSETFGYRILGISLRKGEYDTPLGGDAPRFYVKSQETLVVTAMICNNADGKISYLTIYPYYRINKKVFNRYPKTCDDVLIRITIRRDGSGFFYPKWISCIQGEQEYTPHQAARNKIAYSSLSEDCLTYRGFSAPRALENEQELLESLGKAFLEWLSAQTTRSSVDDPYSGRYKIIGI